MSIDSFVRAIGSGVADRDSRKSAEIQEDLRQKGLKEGLPPAFARSLARSFFDDRSPTQIDFDEYKKLVTYDSVTSRRVLNALFEQRPDLFVSAPFLRRKLTDVLSEIFSLNPQVIAVGEEHLSDTLPPEINPTAQRFAEEVLPRMASEGYKTLVTEMVPYDWPDEERDLFIKTGKIDSENTPYLDACFSQTSDRARASFEVMMQAARRLGIKIVGGGIPLKEMLASHVVLGAIAQGKIMDPPYRESLETNLTNGVVTSVNAYLQSAVQRETRKGTKVVIYSGALHSDTVSVRERAPWSLGDDFSEVMTVAELELFVPENSQTEYTRLLLETLPDKQAPFVRRLLNSWTFVFAEAPQTTPAKP